MRGQRARPLSCTKPHHSGSRSALFPPRLSACARGALPRTLGAAVLCPAELCHGRKALGCCVVPALQCLCINARSRARPCRCAFKHALQSRSLQRILSKCLEGETLRDSLSRKLLAPTQPHGLADQPDLAREESSCWGTSPRARSLDACRSSRTASFSLLRDDRGVGGVHPHLPVLL